MRANVEAMLAHAREYVVSGDLPMVAVAVSEGDGLVCRSAFDGKGNQDDSLCERQFALASISKAITGVLAAILVEQGVLDYDARIVDIIPEFGTNDARKTIRFSQIFGHSTGLPSRFVDGAAEDGYDPQKLLQRMYEEELLDEPGTRCRYSTHTYQLINEAIRRKLGLTMEQALQQYVCGPCGLTLTSFYPDPARAMDVVDHPVPDGPQYELVQRLEMSGGGLWSSLDDLQALGRAWLTDQLVPARARERATALLPGLPYVDNEMVLSRRTLGFCRDQAFANQPEGAFYHGGATGTLWYMDPERDLVFVFLTNRWGASNEQAFATLNMLYG